MTDYYSKFEICCSQTRYNICIMTVQELLMAVVNYTVLLLKTDDGIKFQCLNKVPHFLILQLRGLN